MLPSLSFAAPSTAISGGTIGTGSQGNVNTGGQFSFGGAAWPFGGDGPFSALTGGSANTWKTAAIVLGVLGVLLITHRLHLGKK